MLRVVLLAACSVNVVAFRQRPANQANDSTGAEGHADERPPSNDAPTSRSLLPQKMTYSSNVASGAAPFVNVSPGALKAHCTNAKDLIADGGAKAALAACKARCAADASCKFIVHWSDNGCQLFTSCTAGTHNWGIESTVYEYQVHPQCAQPSWSNSKAAGASGWSRMEGGGQGGQGCFSKPQGYTYHQGAAQPCTRGDFWNSDDGRSCDAGGCNSGQGETCACQYGLCPAGYKMNQGSTPSGWDEWGKRRRYPYPKGHYYPSSCPCRLSSCPQDYHVSNGECVACPAGGTNAAGDKLSDGDTSCTCLANYRVSGGKCVACPTGRTNAAGDKLSDGDSMCDCAADEHVSGGKCVACPAGSTNAAGDKLSDGDSTCDFPAGICGTNQHVSNGECVACPPGTTSDGGDDPSKGVDTGCVCASTWTLEPTYGSCERDPVNGELVVHACVKKIAKGAFSSCKKIKKVTFKHTVSNPVIIEDHAFGQTGVEIVDVPPRATLKENSFWGADALKRLEFRAQSDYSALKIEAGAFAAADRLQRKEVLLCAPPRLRLHASLRLIGAPHVMRRPVSANMNNIKRGGGDPIFKRASGACPGNGWGPCSCAPASGSFACNALLSDGKLVVPSCATDIPTNAVRWCSQIKSFDLTQATSLKSAGTGFLKGTPNLAEVKGLANLPGGVIPYEAFKWSGIGSISIPKQITRIDPGAFESSKLSTLTFEGGRSSDLAIKNQAFKGTAKLVQELVLPATTTELGDWAFEGSGITAVRAEAGSKLKNIGKGAFKKTAQLKTATLPPSVEFIWGWAFEESAVETVAFEGASKLTSIGEGAFKNAAKLTDVTLPAGTSPTIGANAFQGVSASAVKVRSSFDFGGLTASCPSPLTLKRDGGKNARLRLDAEVPADGKVAALEAEKSALEAENIELGAKLAALEANLTAAH
jgi:hypothetical protein